MTKDEALKLALEALEMGLPLIEDFGSKEQFNIQHKAIAAIYETLAQPRQEPVATLWQHGETGRTRITMPNDITDCDARWFKAADLYTTPPQRNPLTDEDLRKLADKHLFYQPEGYEVSGVFALARAIEVAHGIKD